MPMARKTLADNFSLQNLQSSKEGCCPMADVIMRKCAAASLLERQSRLRPVQSLNLALLINAEHEAFLRRIEVKADHVRQFFKKLNIPRQLEGFRLVRLEIVLLPKA